MAREVTRVTREGDDCHFLGWELDAHEEELRKAPKEKEQGATTQHMSEENDVNPWNDPQLKGALKEAFHPYYIFTIMDKEKTLAYMCKPLHEIKLHMQVTGGSREFIPRVGANEQEVLDEIVQSYRCMPWSVITGGNESGGGRPADDKYMKLGTMYINLKHDDEKGWGERYISTGNDTIYTLAHRDAVKHFGKVQESIMKLAAEVHAITKHVMYLTAKSDEALRGMVYDEMGGKSKHKPRHEDVKKWYNSINHARAVRRYQWYVNVAYEYEGREHFNTRATKHPWVEEENEYTLTADDMTDLMESCLTDQMQRIGDVMLERDQGTGQGQTASSVLATIDREALELQKFLISIHHTKPTFRSHHTISRIQTIQDLLSYRIRPTVTLTRYPNIMLQLCKPMPPASPSLPISNSPPPPPITSPPLPLSPPPHLSASPSLPLSTLPPPSPSSPQPASPPSSSSLSQLNPTIVAQVLIIMHNNNYVMEQSSPVKGEMGTMGWRRAEYNKAVQILEVLPVLFAADNTVCPGKRTLAEVALHSSPYSDYQLLPDYPALFNTALLYHHRLQTLDITYHDKRLAAGKPVKPPPHYHSALSPMTTTQHLANRALAIAHREQSYNKFTVNITAVLEACREQQHCMPLVAAWVTHILPRHPQTFLHYNRPLDMIIRDIFGLIMYTHEIDEHIHKMHTRMVNNKDMSIAKQRFSPMLPPSMLPPMLHPTLPPMLSSQSRASQSLGSSSSQHMHMHPEVMSQPSQCELPRRKRPENRARKNKKNLKWKMKNNP